MGHFYRQIPNGTATAESKGMNKLQFKGDWNIAKGKLKQKFAQLTDNDLRYTEGQEVELVGRLQKLTGQTREEMERVIRESMED